MDIVTYTIFFTARDGSEAKITGPEAALEAIGEILDKGGAPWNGEVGTHDQGYYQPDSSRPAIDPGDDYADRAEWKAHRGRK